MYLKQTHVTVMANRQPEARSDADELFVLHAKFVFDRRPNMGLDPPSIRPISGFEPDTFTVVSTSQSCVKVVIYFTLRTYQTNYILKLNITCDPRCCYFIQVENANMGWESAGDRNLERESKQHPQKCFLFTASVK